MWVYIIFIIYFYQNKKDIMPKISPHTAFWCNVNKITAENFSSIFLRHLSTKTAKIKKILTCQNSTTNFEIMKTNCWNILIKYRSKFYPSVQILKILKSNSMEGDQILTTLKLLIIGESGVGKSSLLLRSQSFTSLMADPRQDINRVSSFSRCLNGTFPWRNCSVKDLVS